MDTGQTETGMEQLEALQGRIQTALTRINAGVSGLENASIAADASAQTSQLEQELDEEKTANAQLEERLKTLRARLQEAEAAGGGAAPDDKVIAKKDEDIAALEAEVQLLRNEVGNTTAQDVLQEEVKRLKSALEGARNEIASQKEQIEERETELARLVGQVETLEQVEPEDTSAAVDLAASEAENQRLEREMEELNTALTEARSVAKAAAELPTLAAENVRLKAEIETLQAAVAQAQAQPVATDELAALEAENTQLKDAAETLQAALSAAQAAAEAAPDLVALDAQLQSLRATNDQLVHSNAALRAANAEGVGDAELINQSLVAELEGQRAANATDKAEMNAVISRLEPLLAAAAPHDTLQEEVM